ncbi:MAG: hypothetical protein AAFY20_16170 [Cyanobacteria bacterium J06639_14]
MKTSDSTDSEAGCWRQMFWMRYQLRATTQHWHHRVIPLGNTHISFLEELLGDA